MSIGVPIKVLHEAEGHIVTLETTTGKLCPINIYYDAQTSLCSHETYSI